MVFLEADGTDNKDETDFYKEPPVFWKPGGVYDSFSKDFGYIKTRKVSANLPGLIVGISGRCRQKQGRCLLPS